MSDRNWEAEMAKIDKQLASVSDEALLAESKAVAPTKTGARTVAAPTVAAPMRSAPVGSSAPAAGAWKGWVKVAIAVGAAAGLMFWPWPAQCGGPLIGFTAATGAVSLLGMWSAIGTWRHRLGLAHVASLLVVVWGLVLGAREVLPRAGYAVPTAERSEGWSCPAPSGGLPSVGPGVIPG
ncbi:hypothetical protein [Gemmatimonas groenlandica]|uniref:Uncharacterized protein n=1 Tax=Gemmatimonas groenlandica TaxID=2732249 RepID=A0A6M4ILM1_9BACT|nr:hypothetical protein [Gemmatimonas groenlandica]QJR35550.1 hypothetical protein HKW67_08540 [Gemmatimonas groenlandica]